MDPYFAILVGNTPGINHRMLSSITLLYHAAAAVENFFCCYYPTTIVGLKPCQFVLIFPEKGKIVGQPPIMSFLYKCPFQWKYPIM